MTDLNTPTFIGLGTARSGSTSIYYYLSEHPEVFLATPKELQFFSFYGNLPKYTGPGDHIYNNITNYKSYLQKFDNVKLEKALGEISPIYLYFENSAERIKKHLPNVKLFLTLRNRLDRAFSHFGINSKLGAETTLDFNNAIKQEDNRIKKG